MVNIRIDSVTVTVVGAADEQMAALERIEGKIDDMVSENEQQTQLLGQINEETNNRAAKLDEIASDIEALLTREQPSPAVTSALQAHLDTLRAESARLNSIAAAYEPVTPPSDTVPGETLPEPAPEGGTGEVTPPVDGSGDATVPAGGANT